MTEAVFYSMMCGGVAPVDKMSQDSKTLEMVPSQMDTLVDCKSSMLQNFIKIFSHSLGEQNLIL